VVAVGEEVPVFELQPARTTTTARAAKAASKGRLTPTFFAAYSGDGDSNRRPEAFSPTSAILSNVVISVIGFMSCSPVFVSLVSETRIPS
jgi:hypothetical protein